VKTVTLEQTTLDNCVRDAQSEQVVITRGGVPVALVVGLEGLDEEQVELGSSDAFWGLIAERRRQKTLNRAELEQRLSATD
jgi:antitoxin (DNA-binding transcriptional repressor) of toxin-antitoxin stability system